MQRDKLNKTINQDIELWIKGCELLDMNDVVNCLLVKNGLRPAYMIQTVDWYRRTRNLLTDMKNITKIFGLSFKDTYQGVLVFLDCLQIDSDSSWTDYHETLGRILGYPCYEDFKYHVNRKKYKTTEKIFCLNLGMIVSVMQGTDEKENTVLITSTETYIMANISLESNVEKFFMGTRQIIEYIKLLDSRMREDPRTKQIKLDARIETRIVYCIKDRLNKYMAYISQKDDVVDESNDESNDVDQIRENVYDVLNNFGFETIEILCQKYSLDIFNRNMHDLVSGALYNSTCEADSVPGPIGTNPDDKFQFIKEQMIKNGLSECTDHISKMSLK